jgi:pimeloyl-ACP methyl ester carboxylesterase
MKLTRGVISIILIIHVVVILFAAYRLFFDKKNDEKKDELSGKVVDVIEKKESDDVQNVYIKIQSDSSAGEKAAYYFDDFFMVYLIENTHSLLFSDFINQDISSQNLSVKFKGVRVEQRKVNGKKQPMIVEAEKIYPDYPGLEPVYDYQSINPGCPEPDYYHRYIQVPVSYEHPGWGQFDLYYELCSDYEEGKPTLIVPTDGQRTFSQVGWADRYKRDFKTSLNVVTYEYRGMYCSGMDWLQKKDRDWVKIYESLKSDNVVEDIERIRKDLLGDEKIHILGGSGTAMIGLKYMAKYHSHAGRAFLMSFFKDARGSSESGIMFFEDFLKENGLGAIFQEITQTEKVPQEQLLFLIQRLLYYDQTEAVELIKGVHAGDLTLYNRFTKQLGTVDYFIRSSQKYKPWGVVFMYETNIPTSKDGSPDINYPFLKEGEMLAQLAEEGSIPDEKFDIENLDKISNEILLIGGTLDQVAPISETMRIHKQLPNSKFAVFDAYHCLQQPAKAKNTRNKLVDLFFLHGSDSEEFNKYLNEEGKKAGFNGFLDR